MDERLLCLDVGDVRIGVAVSDPSRIIATPVEVIHRVGWGPDVRRVRELCDRYQTHIVVSGLPLNMDGTAGFQTQKVRSFCEQVEKSGLTVIYQDERLTTVTAEEALLEGDVSREGRKKVVDKVAAALILQQYLDEQNEAAKKQQTKEDAPMIDENESLEPMEDEDEPQIVELVDEEGQTVRFEHLATIEHEKSFYILLTEETDDDDADAEVVVMKIAQDEDGNEIYIAEEDEAVEEAVFEKYIAMIEDAEGDEDDAEE